MDDWYEGLPASVRFVLGTLVFGGLTAAGWFVGHRFWHDATLGVCVGLFAWGLAFAMTDEDTRAVVGHAVVVFLLGIPLIYLLVLLTQLPLLAFGLAPFSAPTFFVRSLLGALIGTGVAVVLNLKGTFSKAAEGSRDFDIRKWFFNGMSFRTASAFLIAGLSVVPVHRPAAMLTLGATWGLVAAAVQAVFTVLVDRNPVRDGWLRIVLVEAILAFGFIAGLSSGISDHELVWSTLELVPSAALTCAAAYGLLHLVTAVTAPRVAAQEDPPT